MASASATPRQPETMQANVAIIGAGPAGTATAAHLGQLGVEDVVLVDKHDFPRDKTCGSAVSPRGIKVLRELGVWPRVEPHALWIRGMRLVTPGGRESIMSGGQKLDAIVCKRRVLDHLLLERAIEQGVRFVPGVTATQLLERDGRVSGFVARDGREVRARYTVIAGGTHCTLTTKPRPQPKRLIQAIMGWWENVEHEPNFIEMIFDKMISPYYGWLFPEDDRVVNIGITYEDPAHELKARQLFQRFLDKHYKQRLSTARQVGKWKGHPIAYDYRVENLSSPGRVVVGEAGRMTHPATAEGIYQGMRSGMMAAEALRDILAGVRSEREALRRYERGCRRAFNASFIGGALFRKAVQTPVLDWVVSTNERPLVKSMTAKIMALM